MLQIDIQHLSRHFGDRRVLADLSFSMEAGDRVAVTGSNGSGKTTLLKVLAGLLRPTEGRIVARFGEEQTPEWLRRKTGYLAPDLVLYDELTPLENLQFFRGLRGLAVDGARDRDLLGRLGLSGRFHDPLGTLSTGLRQRAKLAFAVQAAPALLLLDEPSANLDAAGRSLIREVVDEAGDAIVIIATNDPLEAELGRRTLALD